MSGVVWEFHSAASLEKSERRFIIPPYEVCRRGSEDEKTWTQSERRRSERFNESTKSSSGDESSSSESLWMDGWMDRSMDDGWMDKMRI